MRSNGLATILALAAVLVATPAIGQDAADRLRTIEHQRLKALVDADVATARRLHADDFQLVNPSGATLTKDEYLGQIASGALDYLVWEPGPIEVRLYGAAAVLRYSARAQAKVGQQTTSLARFWHTDVYEQRACVWQVVWSQATAVE
jgi:Domain of unknown function (DUF4440)